MTRALRMDRISQKSFLALSLLTFSLAAVLLSQQMAKAQNMPKPKVLVGKVVNTLMAPTLNVPGSVVSLHDSRLAAETSATADWIAEVGTQVKKGDPVARLNQRLLKLDLASNDADIKRIEAQLDYRRKELGRLQKLLKGKSIPESRYDAAFAEYAVLEQELAQARTRRDRTRYLLDKSVIRAPANGWVVERFISVGEYVSAGEEVVRFVDTEEKEISAQAPLNLLPFLQEGMTVRVSDGDNTIPSRIRSIIPVGDDVSRMVEIRLEVPQNTHENKIQQNRSWVVGTALRVNLPRSAPKQVTAIPRDALIIRAGRNYVVRINEAGQSENIPVVPGIAEGDLIEVTGRLKSGDRVVVRGGETLRPGQEVDIMTNAAAL